MSLVFCKECKHFVADDRPNPLSCVRDMKTEVDLVVGGEHVVLKTVKRCYEERHGDLKTNCGVEGKFYEPRTDK